MRMLIISASDTRAMARLIERDEARQPAVERTAARIIADVRKRGDVAVADYERRFKNTSGAEKNTGCFFGADGWKKTPGVFFAPADFRRAAAALSAAERRAFERSAGRIAAIARRQVPRGFTARPAPGVTVEQRVAPLDRVGCYVPGGRFPLPSTLLMTAIPARAAGVREVVVCCPRPTAAVLAAAAAAGVDALYPIGGAQAIAALAYGTATIARVDKIVGPGNAWVAAAKALVARDCPIDLHAGPSEIVICSDRGRAGWIAADLIAQAEHDPAARAILVTTKSALARAVSAEVASQVRQISDADWGAIGPPPTRSIGSTPVAAGIANGAIVVARSRDQATDIVNRLAPEHLVCDTAADVRRFTAAGTIFVGQWSAQASGDYATGSNHVLPTGGAARFRGGLSAADFVRVFSVQTLTRRGIETIGPDAIALARIEGLAAHAASISQRMGRRGLLAQAPPSPRQFKRISR